MQKPPCVLPWKVAEGVRAHVTTGHLHAPSVAVRLLVVGAVCLAVTTWCGLWHSLVHVSSFCAGCAVSDPPRATEARLPVARRLYLPSIPSQDHQLIAVDVQGNISAASLFMPCISAAPATGRLGRPAWIPQA